MTKISWCDETINPVVGCSKISEGCRNCYAENMAARLAGMGNPHYKSVVLSGHGCSSFKGWNGLATFVESQLFKAYSWRKPRSVFICSMGDLFHESVWRCWIDDVMKMVANNSQHTFIILTKRPERMKEYFDLCDRGLVDRLTALYQLSHGTDPHDLASNWPLPNLVLGVSAENQQAADERIKILLQIPAVKRFVSIEPMLEEIDLYRGGWSFLNPLYPPPGNKTGWKRGLDGVILGGESGSKARPLHPDWVRKVRDQCAAAGVPFMFKQWGEWVETLHVFDCPTCPSSSQITTIGMKEFHRVGKKTAGNMLDGRAHTELPWAMIKGGDRGQRDNSNANQ